MLRDLREDDIPGIVDILRRTWDMQDDYGISEDEEISLMTNYFADLMERTTYVKVADDDGLCGVVMGSVFSDEPIDLKIEKVAVRYDIATKDLAAINDADDSMLEECSNRGFDCELILYIVDPTMKGKGIGRTMMENVIDHFKERGCRKMFLFTDGFCDVGIYRHLGYHEEISVPVKQGPEEKVFTFYLFSALI